MNLTAAAAGVTFKGRPAIENVAQELRRQSAARLDSVADTEDVRFMVAEDQFCVQVPGIDGLLTINEHAHSQLAEYVGLPKSSRLYKRLRAGQSDDVSQLWQTWADLYNAVFEKQPKRKLFRTMVDRSGERYLRAFLSDRYQILDNDSIFHAAFEAGNDAGAVPWHARLSDSNFYLYLVSETLTAEIDRHMDGAARGDHKFYERQNGGGGGEVHHAACMIRNSEVGAGRIEIRPAIVNSVCSNYLVLDIAISKIHLGGKIEENDLLTAGTIRKKNELFFDELRDIVSGVFDPERFQKYIDSIHGATRDPVENPVEAANALQVVYGVSEERRDAILSNFAKGGDTSRYGLISAITLEAHSNDSVVPEVGVELETLGAALLGTTMGDVMDKYDKAAEKEEATATA